MSRGTLPLFLALTITGTAFAADNTIAPGGRRQTVQQLPAGLPRAHYGYKTTVADQAPYQDRRIYVRPRPADEVPDVLFTPVDPYIPYAPLISRPFLPGSSALPGYYGSSNSYYYQGPYYGGSGTGHYWTRLPYACGVVGYC